jgi:hypothetical protein
MTGNLYREDRPKTVAVRFAIQSLQVRLLPDQESFDAHNNCYQDDFLDRLLPHQTCPTIWVALTSNMQRFLATLGANAVSART